MQRLDTLDLRAGRADRADLGNREGAARYRARAKALRRTRRPAASP
jgi:hypothetical protein